MPKWVDLATSRTGTWVTNIAAAALWFRFGIVHVYGYLETGALPILLFTAAESIIAVLFLVRKRAANVADDLVTWAVGIAGTLAPFLFDPAPTDDVVRLNVGGFTMLVGVTMQILGLISLNRSFGIVAAEREVKTTGMYRMVRHPIYLAYVFVWTAYFVINTTVWNGVVFVVATGLMIDRIRREERLLLGNDEYRRYTSRVPYRLLPYVW